MTCRVEQPQQGISVTHYQAQGHSDKPQLLLWFQENFPSIPIGVNDLPFVKSVALLVGVSKYEHLSKLDFVENDVDEMLKWLLLEERFDDVYVLRDEDASPRSVNNLMFNYFPYVVGPRDRFLFYYSGHGTDLKTNVGYFVFGNATHTFDQDAYLPVDTWRQWSARLSAKEQLFLLDGCSLGLGLTVTVKSAPQDSDALLRRMAKDPGRLVFSATKGREESYGSAKASYFTQEFLNAVRSEQRDPNSLGFTTIDKVAALMEPKLASLTQSQGVDWVHTTPIPLDRNEYPGTFVFVNPKVSERSSSEARDFVANAVGKSPDVDWFAEAKRYLDAADYVQALPLLQKAADIGNVEAMRRLGDLYYGGVTRDYTQARQWYQRAAEAGNSSAMNRLGWLYQIGWGGAQDYTQACQWYQKAADAGNSEAMARLADLYYGGVGGLTQDFIQAYSLYRKAADAGYVPAMEDLADMYRDGLGVAQDVARARYWYEKAAASGDKAAMDKIEELYSK